MFSLLIILVRGWLYRDIIFSQLTIFGQGVIISWHHIFTPDNISWGGDYIVTWYFHPWQYLVRGWLCRDVIFSLLAIFGQGVNIYCDIIFFTPGNIWWGGDYILTYFHSWQYLVRGWIYRDIIFSLLIIFVEGVIISWHYIFTPGNIWRGDDYIVTLYFHSWQYLVRGVIIPWHIFTPEDISWGGDYIVTLQYHFWRYPKIWHWRWLYLNIFTIQIHWQIIHIHIFTPWNLGGWSDYI